ncbi:MAG: beta-lactamase family protein [Treponema sp.]|jgi:CubicO group peptidase (beta-lactamase class C family)|nr:beta-lactamase family protein [Treponema sp.]
MPKNVIYEEKLKELLKSNAGHLYGKAVCAVNKNGEALFRHSVNCGTDAVFDLASVSKVLTGTMVFRLIGEGALSLPQTLDLLFENKPIGPITKSRFKNMTLRSLLTHSSGLPAWFPFYTRKDSFWKTLEDVLEKCPVEAGAVYSDLGFMLLGEAVVSASGRSLPQNLDALNAALGTSFTYNPKNRGACVETEAGNRIEKRMCDAYKVGEELGLSFDGFRDTATNMRSEVNDGNAFYFWGGIAGHAGVFGTAEDLLKLGGLYLDAGKINGKQLIPPRLIGESTIDYGGERGLMWDLSDIYIHGFGHTGFTGTSLYLCPEKALVATILTNRLVIEPAPNLREFRMEAHTLMNLEPYEQKKEENHGGHGGKTGKKFSCCPNSSTEEYGEKNPGIDF